MKKILTVVILATTLCLGPLVAATGNVERSHVCMMQDMVLTKPGIPIEYQGKTYYGCCEMCKQKIKSEPNKYTRAIDLVSGKKVDKAQAFIYGLDGTAYYFASEANRRAFAGNPTKFLKK
jgi:YHS domain-containing protein